MRDFDEGLPDDIAWAGHKLREHLSSKQGNHKQAMYLAWLQGRAGRCADLEDQLAAVKARLARSESGHEQERCRSMYPYTEFGPGTRCVLPANHLGQLHRSAPVGCDAFLWL